MTRALKQSISRPEPVAPTLPENAGAAHGCAASEGEGDAPRMAALPAGRKEIFG